MQPDKNWAVERARYQVKVCGDHESNPGRPTGGSWDQICLPWALRGPTGPQKGPFGAKMSPFRAPWPDTWSKCVVTMNPTKAGQSRAVGTESASPGPSEDLQGPKRVLSGPKRTLFACFLELGGSIWAITVLNEPGIPL